jgi:hypothetical protein
MARSLFNEESKNPKASLVLPPDGSKFSEAEVEQIYSGSFLWPKIAKHFNDMVSDTVDG